MKIRSPLDRLPERPAEEIARLEKWLQESGMRQQARWPAERQQLLEQAQQAEVLRKVVLF